MHYLKRKRVISWALYDWANSAFATTVMAGFFPLFLSLFGQQIFLQLKVLLL